MIKTCENEQCNNETKNPKYCSKNCSAIAYKNSGVSRHKNPIVYTCRFCKIKVPRKRSFCSFDCETNWRKCESIINWMLGDLQSMPPHIKSIILREQENKCIICQMSNEWNNEPIVFVLDHVDGNAENNKRVNLRLVCPNCDSQLPTFKSRNRGNGRYLRRQRYLEGKSA